MREPCETQGRWGYLVKLVHCMNVPGLNPAGGGGAAAAVHPSPSPICPLPSGFLGGGSR